MAKPALATVLILAALLLPACGDSDQNIGPPTRFVDNGDGTITDTFTTLMWEKKVALDGVANDANPHDADNVYPWNGECVTDTTCGGMECAVGCPSGQFCINGFCSTEDTLCQTTADCPSSEKCQAQIDFGVVYQSCAPNQVTIFQWVATLNAANFAGHTDWRVPNVSELQSIIDYGTFNPSVNTAFNGASCGGGCTDLADPACSCTAPDNYWSSTGFATSTSDAWYVNFVDGMVNQSFTFDGFYARAVRGG